MNITKVALQNFKRFSNETFELNDCFVMAGPNNSGKTTLLQAIAAWHLALTRWRELNDYQCHDGTYTKAPIARQSFHPVPLHTFELLWHQRNTRERIQIAVTFDDGVEVPIEIIGDTTEQVYVRPLPTVEPALLKNAERFPKPVFVPAMTGLAMEEPVYQRPRINQLLGQGKPGDVLRNLLFEAHISEDKDAWNSLVEAIQNIFGHTLLPPNADGPSIVAEYQHQGDEKRYDIASAGSGFLQVLMLLTFLKFRPGTILLLDEPDAHLHVLLQDRVYSELRRTAWDNKSQLVISTHSEVLINSVEPSELCALLSTPTKLANDEEKAAHIHSLPALSNMDIMLAREKGCVLYLAGHADLELLRTWAGILGHKAADFLEQPFWKPNAFATSPCQTEIETNDHFEALQRAQKEIRGIQIINRDGNERLPREEAECDGSLLRLCWDRCGIESYLVHYDALARFVAQTVGPDAQMADPDQMKQLMHSYMGRLAIDNPLQEHSILNTMKAREHILCPILQDVGIINLPCTRYAEIARVMQPDEIHPEVTEKLDAITEHLGLWCLSSRDKS